MSEGQGSWELGTGLVLHKSQLAALRWKILPKLLESQQEPTPDTEAHVWGENGGTGHLISQGLAVTSVGPSSREPALSHCEG